MRSIKKTKKNKNRKKMLIAAVVVAGCAALFGLGLLGLKIYEDRHYIPEVKPKEEITVLISPGRDLAQLKDDFLKKGFSAEEIDRAFSANYNSPLLLDRPAGASLEGYIFPDTYQIFADDDLTVLIQNSIDHFYEKLQSDGSMAKIAASGRSFYETLTLASIVQQEASDSENQAKIAGVFNNRLNNGMVLGSDVTYKYAFRNGLCAADDPDDCDSPYNTRKEAGLPPSPISNVLYSTLQAEINPIDTDYLYFVASEDGGIYYARTENEHFNNIALHCGKLCW